MESPLMTVKEACAYLKVSTFTIYSNLVYREDFPAIKVGGSWRIIKKDLDAWIIKQLEDKPLGDISTWGK